MHMENDFLQNLNAKAKDEKYSKIVELKEGSFVFNAKCLKNSKIASELLKKLQLDAFSELFEKIEENGYVKLNENGKYIFQIKRNENMEEIEDKCRTSRNVLKNTENTGRNIPLPRLFNITTVETLNKILELLNLILKEVMSLKEHTDRNEYVTKSPVKDIELNRRKNIKIRIIIHEDVTQEDFINLISRKLIEDGFVVELAHSESDFHSKVTKERFHFIVIDCILFEIYKKKYNIFVLLNSRIIKTSEITETEEISKVLYRARDTEKKKYKGYIAGISNLRKPYTYRELISLLEDDI